MVTAKTARKVAPPLKAKTPAVAPASGKGVLPAKVKHKIVRDSFTIPKSEYEVLQGLKARAIKLKQPAKKSELLRAGIAALKAMDDKAFMKALAVIPTLKTGRPKADAEPAPVAAGKPPAKPKVSAGARR